MKSFKESAVRKRAEHEKWSRIAFALQCIGTLTDIEEGKPRLTIEEGWTGKILEETGLTDIEKGPIEKIEKGLEW
jgi:hypothetical protein